MCSGGRRHEWSVLTVHRETWYDPQMVEGRSELIRDFFADVTQRLQAVVPEWPCLVEFVNKQLDWDGNVHVASTVADGTVSVKMDGDQENVVDVTLRTPTTVVKWHCEYS